MLWIDATDSISGNTVTINMAFVAKILPKLSIDHPGEIAGSVLYFNATSFDWLFSVNEPPEYFKKHLHVKPSNERPDHE